MQVLPVFKTNLLNNTLPINRSADYSTTGFGIRMAKPLEKDTVSFKAYVKFEKILETTADKTNQKLLATATIYMDVLESIAMKLKDYGVSFDRKYCEPNAIKSAKSVVSKIKRAKTFKIPDRIRGTLYSKNIYDLSILINHILPELEKRGYIVAQTETSLEEAIKRGYKPNANEIKKGEVLCPDIDIRLDNELLNTEALPKNLEYYVGKPQASGYEDIQIRLLLQKGLEHRSSVNNTLHELIILVGPEYAKTKHDESDKIYNYIRQFKELNIYNNSRTNSETISLIKRYIELISKMFSTEISQKVYENAKNFDIYGIKKAMPISLSEDDEKTLTGYYDSLEKLTKEYYKVLESKSKSEKSKEILNKQRKEDQERLAIIRKGLTDAVDFYKNKYNKQNTTKKKAKN